MRNYPESELKQFRLGLDHASNLLVPFGTLT